MKREHGVIAFACELCDPPAIPGRINLRGRYILHLNRIFDAMARALPRIWHRTTDTRAATD